MNEAKLLYLTERQYHADEVGKTPTLSPSQAHTLLSKSPAHLWLEHPRLGNQPKPVSNEKLKRMEEGSLLHKLILGAGKEYQVIFGFDDYMKKEARELRDGIRDSGKVPVLESTFDECVLTANQVKEKLKGRGIELTGESEMMMTFNEEVNGEPVPCRIMPDHFIYSIPKIYELKSVETANPEFCERQIRNMGYDIQMAAYLSGLSTLHPDLAGRIEFNWIFFECEPPYAVTVAQPDGMMRERGWRLWKAAVESWHRCLTTDTWPEYSDEIVMMTVPLWLMKQEMQEEFYG